METIVLHKNISSKSVLEVIGVLGVLVPVPQKIKFEPFSVSVLAIKTNQPPTNPFFLIGVYIYCHGVHVKLPPALFIQTKLVFLSGSLGILPSPPLVNSSFILSILHAVIGKLLLST